MHINVIRYRVTLKLRIQYSHSAASYSGCHGWWIISTIIRMKMCISNVICGLNGRLLLQSHVYGHAWSAEDEQSYCDQRHAGCVQRGSESSRRVPGPDQRWKVITLPSLLQLHQCVYSQTGQWIFSTSETLHGAKRSSLSQSCRFFHQLLKLRGLRENVNIERSVLHVLVLRN